MDFSAALRLSLKNISLYGSLRYTRRQLFYEVCRTVRPPKGFDLQTAATVFGAVSLPFLLSVRKRSQLAGLLTANALTFGGLAWLRNSPHTLAPPFSFTDFESWLNVYLLNHQRPAGLIEANQADFSARTFEPDLTLYGLPRLLVCQSDEIAQMLRANHFHLEASCAVLSLRESAPLGKTFRKMLNRAPHPRIYFLHDASLRAYSSIPTLRERLEMPEKVKLTILGLRPIHAQRLHLFAKKSVPVDEINLETIAFLSEDEKRWLREGWTAEVEAVHPARLLQVLRRLILNLQTRQSIWNFKLPPRELGFIS